MHCKILLLSCLIFFQIISSCNDERRIKYNYSKPRYISFKKYDKERVTPPYDYKINFIKSINGSGERYYLKYGDIQLLSFIKLNDNDERGLFATFSNDSLLKGNVLQVNIFDKNNIFSLFHKGHEIIENEKSYDTKIFLIPVDFYGVDTVTIFKNNDFISNFFFVGLKTGKTNEDSLVNLYNKKILTSGISIEIDSIIKSN